FADVLGGQNRTLRLIDSGTLDGHTAVPVNISHSPPITVANETTTGASFGHRLDAVGVPASDDPIPESCALLTGHVREVLGDDFSLLAGTLDPLVLRPLIQSMSPLPRAREQ